MTFIYRNSIDRLLTDLSKSTSDISETIENSIVYYDDYSDDGRNKENINTHYRSIDMTGLEQKIAQLEFVLKQIKKIKPSAWNENLKKF